MKNKIKDNTVYFTIMLLIIICLFSGFDVQITNLSYKVYLLAFYILIAALYKLGMNINTFSYGVIIFPVIFWQESLLNSNTNISLGLIIQLFISIFLLAVLIYIFFEDYFFYNNYHLNEQSKTLSKKVSEAIDKKSTTGLKGNEKKEFKEFKEKVLNMEYKGNSKQSLVFKLKELSSILRIFAPLIPILIANFFNIS